MENFTTRLKEARGNASQTDVALMIGIKQQAYARYENGDTLPGAEILQRICCALNVSADWLLGLGTRIEVNQNDWRARAIAAEKKLERVNKALGHALKGFEELQEAVK